MRSRRPAVVLLLVVLGAAPAAGADLAGAEADFLHGRYEQAARAFAAAARRGDRRAELGLGRVLLRVGDYAKAEAAARRAARGRGTVGDDGRTLLAEVLRATGRRAEAEAELRAVLKRRPQALRACLLLARTVRERGAAAEAQRLCESFIDDYNARRIDRGDATALEYVAAASHLCGNFGDAKDTYLEALSLRPDLLEANLELGFLFLEKYNSADAARSFEEVLRIDPRHPDAHLGMARAALEESFVVAEAERHLAQALAANPRHVGALVARGEILLTDEDYGPAREVARRALAVDPGSLPALTLLGGCAFLADDRAAYEAVRARVLKQNPRAAAFFHDIAEFAARQHRYAEAITLDEEAIRLDPEDPLALAGLGQNWLRLGDDARGLEQLRRAWKVDPYNARTYNILNLFEDTIPAHYGFVARGHFRLRVPKRDRAVIERYALPLLERAYADMVKRYGFAPPGPVQVELFADSQAYAVRTVGLPGLGALGVCFGRVITSMSPRGGGFNWAMVLWHELGHVFSINLSHSRVPRWFTEGLSEWEARRARPEWRRKSTAAIVDAIEAGTLPPIARLNTAFTRARSIDDMVVAYHQSALVVDFLIRRFGFAQIVAMLKLWGQRLPTAAVLERTTGLAPAALDAQFRQDLRARLPWYFGAYTVRYERFRDLEALEQAARARPADALAQAHLGFGYLARGAVKRAQAQADKALKLAPGLGEALILRGEIGMALRDAKTARAAYLAAIHAGLDGYEVRARLGIVALRAGDLAEGIAQLTRAKQLDPEQDEPYQELARAYDKAGRTAEALAELEALVKLNPQSYAPLKRLVTTHAAAGRWDRVRVFGPMALNIDPYDATVHLLLGRAYAKAGQRRQAVFELESALLCGPDDRAAVERELRRLR